MFSVPQCPKKWFEKMSTFSLISLLLFEHLVKPAEVGDGFVCGCGHEEKTLAALGKHKDRTGHACWNNNTYDSLRDLILNEDLRISCGGALV